MFLFMCCSFNPTAGEICKLDLIRVLESSYGATISCGPGEFIELKGIKNIRTAMKILKDYGVLEILVKEGAFKTTFRE